MTGRAGKMQHFRYGVAKVRGRWYYRYHKPIGKANWKGYQERYIVPKDVEAKQRLVFAPKATTKQQKQAISWQWRLPKLLASATNPNQVLDAWILFRYKQPKRMSHYLMTLKRLVDVGGCDPTDWRLRVLLSRMRKGFSRVNHLDVLLRYFSHLKLHAEMEMLTRFLKPRIFNLKVYQHVSILTSFARCQLRDTAVAGLCIRYIQRSLSKIAPRDLIRILKSLGSIEVRNSKFVSELLLTVLSHDLSLVDLRDILGALRTLRIRDYAVIEFAVSKCMAALNRGSMKDFQLVCDVMFHTDALGVFEQELIEVAVKTIDPLQLPVKSLVNLLLASSKIDLDRDQRTRLLEALKESSILIRDQRTLLNAIKASDSLVRVGDTLIPNLADILVSLPRDRLRYNVSELARLLAKHGVYKAVVWTAIAKDMMFSSQDFDPEDFITAASVFRGIPLDLVSEDQSVLATSIAEWSLKRWEEFTPVQWDRVSDLISEEGSPFRCNEWCRVELTKWRKPSPSQSSM